MTPSPTAAEKWAFLTALVAGTAALLKKFLPRPKPPHPEHITRAEFHAGMDAVRDRIGASYLALADKVEQQHTQLLSKLDCQGANFEHRLDSLEANLARLDERTKSHVGDDVRSL
jgi:hypothetical protein